MAAADGPWPGRGPSARASWCPIGVASRRSKAGVIGRVEQQDVGRYRERPRLAQIEHGCKGAAVEPTAHLVGRTDAPCWLAKALAQLVDAAQRAQVGRYRVEATAWNQPRSAGRCRLVKPVDQAAHPEDLTCDVEVIDSVA